MSLGWGIIGTGGFAGNATATAINALGNQGSLVAVVSRDRVHPYDLVRYLLGSEVREVMAMTDVGRSTELEGMALALLRFQNGTMAHVNANQTGAHFQPDIDIHGTEGRIVGIDCTRPFREGELRVLTQAGERVIKHSSKDAVVRSVRAFNDAVRDDREPNPSGLDGRRSVQLTEAAIRSARAARLVEVTY